MKIYYGHSISDPQCKPEVGPDRANSLLPEVFEKFLSSHGEETYFTFDDGYADNLTTLLPLLEKYQKPATIFITTGFVERSYPPIERVAAYAAMSGKLTVDLLNKSSGIMPKNLSLIKRYELIKGMLRKITVFERSELQTEIMDHCRLSVEYLNKDILTLNQLKILDSHPLVTIGAHTISHPNLRYATDAEIKQELFGSRVKLEEWLGHEVKEMAYPYGGHDQRVRKAVRRAGYKKAYTTRARGRQRIPALCSPFAVRRYDLNEGFV